MIVRSQYQYTPLVGPVFTPTPPPPFDPQNLDWMPRGQQPARGLAPNRLGDFVVPSIDAQYKPQFLEWIPKDRYFGRSLARAPERDYTVRFPAVGVYEVGPCVCPPAAPGGGANVQIVND